MTRPSQAVITDPIRESAIQQLGQRPMPRPGIPNPALVAYDRAWLDLVCPVPKGMSAYVRPEHRRGRPRKQPFETIAEHHARKRRERELAAAAMHVEAPTAPQATDRNPSEE